LSEKRVDEAKEMSEVDSMAPLEEATSLLIGEQSPNGHKMKPFEEDTLMESIHLANEYYDKNVVGEPESERRLIGPVVALLKRIVRKATAWYVQPAMEKQRSFNASVTRSINEMKQYLDHLQINEDILSTLVHRDLELFRANIMFLNSYLERRLIDFDNEFELLKKAERAEGLQLAVQPGGANGAGEGDRIVDSLDILSLEQRVQGSPRMARDRQKVYLKYLRGCANVLSLGCGRGELLQLLSQEGISARGTEMNATLADYCRDHGLDVVRADSMDFIEAQEDGVFGGITLSRFAGHKPMATLVRMLTSCRSKLKDDGILIIETPNPFSIYTIASYALQDSASGHPLHPETLKLLCLSCGFVDPDIIFLDPLPPEERLEEIDLAAVGAVWEPREQELFHMVNQNFAKINRIIFSHRDYSVVARQSRWDSS
jgi:2-polyprenyl-3-methyl-5-hydroxy-6-metoxy-1,4-benzoquinol methylase